MFPIADELSMHLLTTPLIYRLLTFKTDPQRTKLIGLGLSALFTIVMVTHMVMDEFLLHATTFGLGVYIIASRGLKIIPEQVPDPNYRKALRNTAILGCCKPFRLQQSSSPCSRASNFPQVASVSVTPSG